MNDPEGNIWKSRFEALSDKEKYLPSIKADEDKDALKNMTLNIFTRLIDLL